jgi:hypothetical protein
VLQEVVITTNLLYLEPCHCRINLIERNDLKCCGWRVKEGHVEVSGWLSCIEKAYGVSLFHWNGILLHIAITIHVDLSYAIMRISGYLAAPTMVIFQALDHTTSYLYFKHHLPILYPHYPLSKSALAMHWAKGSAEFLLPEYGTMLINSADADHARDIRDRRSISSNEYGTMLINSADADHAHDIRDIRSISSNLHKLNGVIVSCKSKKQATPTLHSTGSEIVSLTDGVKKTNHLRDFMASIGYPSDDPTPTFEDNQGIIQSIKASQLHENTRHLATCISWPNEQYIMGIIKLMYTIPRRLFNFLIAKPHPFVVNIYNPEFDMSFVFVIIPLLITNIIRLYNWISVNSSPPTSRMVDRSRSHHLHWSDILLLQFIVLSIFHITFHSAFVEI